MKNQHRVKQAQLIQKYKNQSNNQKLVNIQSEKRELMQRLNIQ